MLICIDLVVFQREKEPTSDNNAFKTFRIEFMSCILGILQTDCDIQLYKWQSREIYREWN